jgi:hypothetical protein
MKNTKRTFKTVLAERAKLVGCKTPSQYKAFYDACRYVSQKFAHSHRDFNEWFNEESFFD